MRSPLLFILCLLSVSTVFSKTLIITDSHGEGTFGSSLAKFIENKNESVSIYAAGGSTPKDWVYGLSLPWGYWEHHTGKKDIRTNNPTLQKFDNILKKENPQTVVIVQGTNLIWREQQDQDIQMIKKLITSVQNIGAKCYWVGAPDLDPRTASQKRREIEIQILLQTQTHINNCELIASWEFTHYPDTFGDGIHYDQVHGSGPILARRWAQNVSKLIN